MKFCQLWTSTPLIARVIIISDRRKALNDQRATTSGCPFSAVSNLEGEKKRKKKKKM